MKLVINIPCYNEEKTLPLVLKELPKKIPGIEVIEVQIVDDGSTDKTVAVAEKYNVTRIIKHKKNLGLGTSFRHGVEAALDHGADIFVNTDADNQYPSRYIAALVEPVVKNRADMTIGNRTPWKVKHFSPLKRMLQYFGNGLMRFLMGSDVPDTVSGFRAYSKYALLKINVTTKFSYVLDTIMQAVQKGLKIECIEIDTNAPTRKSRLFKNIFEHMRKSFANMVRLFYLYEPFKTFTILSSLFLLPGLILLGRYLGYWFLGQGAIHIQSLVFSAIILIAGVLLFGFAIIGDSIKISRMLIEEQLYLKKKETYK